MVPNYNVNTEYQPNFETKLLLYESLLQLEIKTQRYNEAHNLDLQISSSMP